MKLGANATLSSVVVKLNPDTAWGTRTQTFSMLGREQSSSPFTTLVGSATYNFSPASGNTVTIPVSATVADVRLSFTANTGAPGGQVAEFQVIGTAAPNPDLTVSGMSFSPASPVETDAVTLSATVRNAGTAGSPASNVNFYLGTTRVGTATVGALAAGASARSARTSARATRAPTRSARTSTRPTPWSSRTTPTTATPTRATSWSPRSPAPTWSPRW